MEDRRHDPLVVSEALEYCLQSWRVAPTADSCRYLTPLLLANGGPGLLKKGASGHHNDSPPALSVRDFPACSRSSRRPSAIREQHYKGKQRRSCQPPCASNPQTWWRTQIGQHWTTPDAADPTFQHYRSVADYGADSSGKEDVSDAPRRGRLNHLPRKYLGLGSRPRA
ncbi:uncharacterized protein THITE_2106635 [Thermothielavioides terrestris NRRL 8126]|uniref:Uncharacterized protein n=1 Tax=Thermothielavioides terrestris (strain ATCC 38088 / NRRL 8126) TaxID=578455 RepID=G2QR02_THETT|nr:uncharacterized protein THITE_2106635 [Thermothielavioides terrestris NRRL 8126]AEO62454.1 hypothetical protein THITE_2106635 [Thermothielavioides terrestris NRRL 8126]